jgi:hypothetical protein
MFLWFPWRKEKEEELKAVVLYSRVFLVLMFILGFDP